MAKAEIDTGQAVAAALGWVIPNTDIPVVLVLGIIVWINFLFMTLLKLEVLTASKQRVVEGEIVILGAFILIGMTIILWAIPIVDKRIILTVFLVVLSFHALRLWRMAFRTMFNLVYSDGDDKRVAERGYN